MIYLSYMFVLLMLAIMQNEKVISTKLQGKEGIRFI